jgi:branched-chain amino acid transport system permease protein
VTLLFVLELGINGALVGLMYSLVALGIVLVYKSSSVFNFAQGALVMLAAYIVWAAARHAGVVGGIAAATVLMAAVGLGIERVALRRMIGQPLAMALMLTLGLEIMLRGLGPAVWGADTKRFDLGISEAPLFVGAVLVNRTYIAGGIAALLLLGLFLLFFRTRLGITLRAVSDDQVASWSVGISVERAVGMSWVLASVAATIAGTFWAAVQGVDWSISLLLIKATAVAILGGLDSLGGVVIAGLAVGVMESVVSGSLDPIVGGGTKEIVALTLILVTILLRPYGLLGREIIERI